MKMKNMLIGGMSLALVACISVGATLAALTANDQTVTNKFTFVDGGTSGKVIEVKLQEPKPDATGTESISGDPETGWTYTNVLPGQELNKKPQIDVQTNAPAYVYVRITEGENVSVTDSQLTANGWKQVTGHTDTYWKAYNAGEKFGTYEDLFTKVTVDDVDVGTTSEPTLIGDITIEIAAIQQYGFADADAAYNSLEWYTAT